MTALDLPSVEHAPQAVRDALDTRNARRADFDEAVRARQRGETAIQTAKVEDRARYAEARDEGRRDPGPAREQAARARLADLERRQEGERLRYDRAEDELRVAVAENVDRWAAELARVWARQDAQCVKALDRLRDELMKRRETRQAAAYVAELQAGGDLGQKVRPPLERTNLRDGSASGAYLAVETLVRAIADFITQSSSAQFLDSAEERSRTRDRQQRLVALRRDPDRAVQAAAAMIEPAGLLTVEDAERVRDGAQLDDVIAEANLRRARQAPTVYAEG